MGIFIGDIIDSLMNFSSEINQLEIPSKFPEIVHMEISTCEKFWHGFDKVSGKYIPEG